VIISGSGFGGSVTALRLTEKGYRVGVMEAGRRFTPGSPAQELLGHQELPLPPSLGMYRIQRIHPPGNVVVLAGAGVGCTVRSARWTPEW
jgi:cholesterol oxidase